MLVLVACGGGGGGGGHDSVALTDFGNRLGTSYCMKEFSCCTSTEIQMDFGAFSIGGQPITTEPQCEMFYSGLFNSLVIGEYMTSIANGRVVYDSNAAGACLDLVDSLSCSEFGTQTSLDGASGCQQFFIPKVADGAACAQDYECTSNNCVGATTQPLKDGACMPLPSSGQTCSFNCASGTYCDFGMHSCQPVKANGGACDSNDTCTSAYCDGANTGSGVCADKPARCDGI